MRREVEPAAFSSSSLSPSRVDCRVSCRQPCQVGSAEYIAHATPASCKTLCLYTPPGSTTTAAAPLQRYTGPNIPPWMAPAHGAGRGLPVTGLEGEVELQVPTAGELQQAEAADQAAISRKGDVLQEK